jgi:hypothetical protein
MGRRITISTNMMLSFPSNLLLKMSTRAISGSTRKNGTNTKININSVAPIPIALGFLVYILFVFQSLTEVGHLLSAFL